MKISPEASSLLLMLGFFLVLTGFLLVLAGLFSSSKVMDAGGGGLIIIGPMPIIFQGRLEPLAILLILIVVALVFLLPLLRLLRLREGTSKES